MEVMGGMEGISMEVEGLEMERDMLRVSLLTNLPGHLWRAKWTTLSGPLSLSETPTLRHAAGLSETPTFLYSPA